MYILTIGISDLHAEEPNVPRVSDEDRNEENQVNNVMNVNIIETSMEVITSEGEDPETAVSICQEGYTLNKTLEVIEETVIKEKSRIEHLNRELTNKIESGEHLIDVTLIREDSRYAIEKMHDLEYRVEDHLSEEQKKEVNDKLTSVDNLLEEVKERLLTELSSRHENLMNEIYNQRDDE